MSFGRIIAPLLIAVLSAVVFSGEALAGCLVSGGTGTTHKCDSTGVNVLVGTGTDVTLGVTDLVIEGTDDGTGFITLHNADGVSANLTLNVTNTSIESPAYLGIFVATGDQEEVENRRAGDITLTVDEASSITAWDAGIYVRAYVGGDVKVTNYAEIFAGSSDEGFTFNGDGISATSDGGAARVENYAHVESTGGRGIVADGGYVSGVDKVSIYNEGQIDSFGDGLRVNAGGSFGADAEIINKGNVIGQDRRGVVAWSASGDTYIENSGEVTSYGGQAIYGMADAGKVTITNDNKLRVIDEDPDTADLNDTSFAGIEAEVDGTGDIDVKNLDDGDILTYDNGIYAHTGSGKVEITNDGKVVAGLAGILTESTDGDVTIDNTGAIFADGAICECADDAIGAVTVRGTDLGDVTINNKTGGVIAANADLDFTPDAEWLDQASVEDLTDLAMLTSSAFAIGTDIDGADSVTITNDGTIIGSIAVGSTDEQAADFGTARIVNNGLWVSSFISGFEEGAGVIENNGRWQTLGTTIVYGDVENSGDLVVTSLAADGFGAGGIYVYGDYGASGDARLVLQWPDESLVGYAPVLAVTGDVSGTTEIVIGRGEALEDFDWTGTPYIPLVVAQGTEDADAGHFYMEDTSYGMLNFKLLYDDSEGQAWYLALDTTDSSEAVADIPFAARNLFKLATEGVGDRLDELRNAYASNGASGGPLGYTASPDDPVTAALAISTPSRPTTNAWVKTTGRYGQGDGYDALAGVIEAGIDTLVDTGAGTLAYGAFGGTGGSRLGFDLADTEATLSGPLLGAYANYSSGRAFLGVIAAAQSLNVDATISGADASFGGLTYGGRIDAGYRFGDELIIEPAVALAASHTSFDTFEMNAMDIGFVDTDSLAAEARVRIARTFALDDVTVTPFSVATIGNDFLGGDGVDAPPNDTVMGNNGGLYGDLSAGVTIGNADGTLSGFAKGNVGYSAGELSGGLKLGGNASF